jgi:hypothetical protein
MGHGVHVGGEVGATGNIRARGASAARIRVCPMSWADGPLGRALWWGLRLGLGALRVRSTVAAADLGGAAAAQRAGTPGPPRGLASRVVRCAAHEMCSTSHDGMCEPSALATAVQFGRASTGAYRAAPRAGQPRRLKTLGATATRMIAFALRRLRLLLVGSALLHLFIMLCSSIKNMNLGSRYHPCIV